MAKDATPIANAAAKVKSTVRRVNKPRTFYMVYKGELNGPPKFAFDRDELIDTMLTDRDVKVEKITLPQGKGRGRKASADGAPDGAGVATSAAAG